MTDRREIVRMPVDVGERKRAGAEAEFARAAMDDNVDGIQAFAIMQGACDLFRSRHRAAEKHRLDARPQPCNERGNVGD
ncbi:hypothetical protein BFX40_21650 [Mesorhizobium sp. SEMIA 3007]|nr:hypothetical protein BFX40_21650 [Mesorhizobium sp. SEMIA 3007]